MVRTIAEINPRLDDHNYSEDQTLTYAEFCSSPEQKDNMRYVQER